jgi:hypothetical protein
LISNFRRILNVVFFLLGNSPESEFCVPTFRKRRHTKFRLREITQKLEYKAFLIFWVFNSRPISLLATNEASLLFFMALVPYAIQKNTISVGKQLKRHNRFQILLALLYLLNSIYEHSIKATAVNCSANTEHSECARPMTVYPHFTTCFIRTQFN